MGIYIKNEEMPESCYECAYSVEKDGICSITEGGCDWGHSRPPHCPLEEVNDIQYEAFIEFSKLLLQRIEDNLLHGERRE